MKKIENNGILITVLLLPYFKPACLEYIAPNVENAFNYLRIAAAFISIILYVRSIVLKREKKAFIIWIAVWQLCMLFSTYINGKELKASIVNVVTMLSFCMLTDTCIRKNARVFLSSLFYLLFALVIINFIVILLYPDGVATVDYYYYPMNFINIDNLLSPTLILSMVVSVIYIWYEGKKVLPYLLMTVCVTTTIMMWSATGVVGMFCFIALAVWSFCRFSRIVISSLWVYLGVAIMNILVVSFESWNLFAIFIRDFLGKDTDLSGRTVMWSQAIKMIQNNFLIGYGADAIGHGYVFWRNRFYYTHNGILEILIQGGIISLLPFLAMVILTGTTLYRFRFHKISWILLAGIFANLVTLLTEAFITQMPLYALFVMAADIENLDQIQSCESKRKRIKILMPAFHVR